MFGKTQIILVYQWPEGLGVICGICNRVISEKRKNSIIIYGQQAYGQHEYHKDS